VRDVDLGVKLGFARPEDIRKIIRRHEKTLRKINQLRKARDWRKGTQGRGHWGQEYWLTEAQALFVVSKAGTAVADDMFAEIAIAIASVEREMP